MDSSDESYDSDSSLSSEGSARAAAVDAWREQAASWMAKTAAAATAAAEAGDQLPSDEDNHNAGLGITATRWRTEQTRRVHVVMLDSLDRDQTVYPVPTAMRLRLPRVYKNVERIDIVQVKFINSVWTFSDTRANTGFTWSDGGGNHVFNIPEGTYSWTDLQTLFSADGFNLTLNSGKGNVTLDRGGAAFDIPWATDAPVSSGQTNWGLGWNLGFPKKNLTGGTSYTGISWPRLFDDYVFLQLNIMEQMNDISHTSPEDIYQSTDSTGQVGHYFAKLLLNNFGCWSQNMIEAPKTFRPPLSRLDRLNFNWLDSTGKPIEGGAVGCEWHMTVRIIEVAEGPAADAALLLGRRDNVQSLN